MFLAASDLIDHPLYDDPLILRPTDPVVTFDPRQRTLWLQALEAPDNETRRQAAAAIAEVYAMGFRGFDQAVPKLMAMLEGYSADRRLGMAAGLALAKMGHRSAAPMLLKINRHGEMDSVLATDPVLAQWKIDQARELWRGRLEDPKVRRAVRFSALHALAQIRDSQSAPLLSKLALGEESADASWRFAAARAWGQLVRVGLEPQAQNLLEPKGHLVDRLVAVTLLAHHESERAVEILMVLAQDREPAVAAIAIQRLLDVAPERLDPLIDRLLLSPDAKVRSLAARALVKYASSGAIRRLGPLLNDHDPGLRRFVHDRLIGFDSQSSLSGTVRQVASQVLAATDWRGQVQAALLLGKIDHEPAADRLIQIMNDGDRHEVRLSAIVALRWLELRQTLPALLKQAQRLASESEAYPYHGHIPAPPANETEPYEPPPLLSIQQRHLIRRGMEQHGEELAQILQTFGVMDYLASEHLMRKLVPKYAPYFPDPRAAAVWALGKIHVDRPDAGLAIQFAERLADIPIPRVNPGEFLQVRYASAIALGRMKSESALSVLRKFYHQEKGGGDPACRWAIGQITGEQMPPYPRATVDLATRRRFLGGIGEPDKVETIYVKKDAASP